MHIHIFFFLVSGSNTVLKSFFLKRDFECMDVRRFTAMKKGKRKKIQAETLWETVTHPVFIKCNMFGTFHIC